MPKEKPTIEYKSLDEKSRILKMTIKDVVREFGTGAHVTVPKGLLGKTVIVIYDPDYKFENKK